MDWKSYAPAVKVAPVFSREGEKCCIELKDWRGFGMWEKEFPFPEGKGPGNHHSREPNDNMFL